MPRRLLAALLLAGPLLAACGDDGTDLGAERADQVRSAATRAGLPAPVADALALAGRAESATFQVEYPGRDGARIVVSQSPPDRRVDVVEGDSIVESRVLHDGVAYRCAPATQGGELRCARAAGALQAPGTFTAEALTAFIEAIAATRDGVSTTVQDREVAGVTATCIVSTPEAGTPIDGTGPGTSELCLSPEGAQLLVDEGEERLVADEYRTDVPEGTFDVEDPA